MKSKKAMSPLFSTIILIAFAVALGGVVMSWGKSTYGSYDPGRINSGCEKASISLVDYSGNAGICYKENSIHATVQNDGELGIEAIKISVLGQDGIYPVSLDKRIDAGDVARLDIAYGSVGKISKVIFVPVTSLLGQQRICPKKGFSAENIAECR